MKKTNIFNYVKEVARDVLLILFMCFIVVFPLALVFLCMWLQALDR